ncbi:MAG: prolyl oligopeptidase family serine peptidase [Planctomycetaceae bacterium]|nr:prolyl oligopeptidase family serine peptidase [Planctomycetaceae bacterium]
MSARARYLLIALLFGLPALADGPQDNLVDNVRQIPPPGIELSAEDREQLETRLQQLSTELKQLTESKTPRPPADLLDDIEIFERAVSQALKNNEFYSPGDLKNAHQLIDTGLDRVQKLKQGNPDWTHQTGLVVRGYRSKLDGTVQPYGLEIGPDYRFDGDRKVRCDLWFHGRGERSLELQFLSQRMRSKGQFPLEGGIVLHPYGRYSNAFKFAGEVDVLEALEDVKRHYRIDEDRVAVRGFSMGGAGCWQMAVHYPDLFFAANPGAGFSETPEFLKSFQGETLNPPWFEERLWTLYDCPGWCENLRHLPTVAYSGEIDRQKQAADVMQAALAEKGIDLVHIIGPDTAHKIHPDSNQLIAERLSRLEQLGRERTPRRIAFTTYTLKYNSLAWLTVNGLKEHWRQSRIEAVVVDSGEPQLDIAIDGITDFSIDFPSGTCPFDVQSKVAVLIDGEQVVEVKPQSDRSFAARFVGSAEGHWTLVDTNPFSQGLVKRHELQGPIDDAFMQPFLFVRPTGKFLNKKVETWVNAEMERAIVQWNRHMRGDVRIKDDTEITDEDLQNFNLILWGCPSSNAVIQTTLGDLPLRWTAEGVAVSSKTYEAGSHVPILIHPNPLNPDRYVVLNSGFTYREYDYLNNARQTPKLPDWAIIDIETPPNSRWPGKVVDADLFDESWQVKASRD